MIEVFKDGSRCIVEKDGNNKVICLRLGKKLNFVYGMRLVDGTLIQNMQYELDAEIPTPGELADKLKDFGATCEYVKNRHNSGYSSPSKGELMNKEYYDQFKAFFDTLHGDALRAFMDMGEAISTYTPVQLKRMGEFVTLYRQELADREACEQQLATILKDNKTAKKKPTPRKRKREE